MEKIKNWLLNNKLSMFLSLGLLISTFSFILGVFIPSKKRALAFFSAFLLNVLSVVEFAAYTLKRLQE